MGGLVTDNEKGFSMMKHLGLAVLAGVLAVRAVVDDDLGAGGGERLDMIAGEGARGGHPAGP